MIAAGINYYGTTELIFLEGNMIEFSYGQTLLFFKEDCDKMKQKNNIDIILDQDIAPSHTSKTNIYLLNKIFSDKGWIQNGPNSPDLAYPIEDLWAIIKPRVKRRNPSSLNE